MSLFIKSTVDELLTILAEDIVKKVNTAIKESGECSVVLSGGNSPKPLYDLLASYEYRSQVEWDNVYFFFADERFVPFNDPENNGAMVKKSFFEPLRIADSRIFYISNHQSPEEAARKYARRIVNHFNDRPIRFDLVLLGLGADAHTASLFPRTAVLREQKALVSAVDPGKTPVSRITLTAPLINEAASVVFLVYGQSKAQAVKNVLEGAKNFEEFPAQLIHPEDGTIDWYLDDAAASQLTKVQ